MVDAFAQEPPPHYNQQYSTDNQTVWRSSALTRQGESTPILEGRAALHQMLSDMTSGITADYNVIGLHAPLDAPFLTVETVTAFIQRFLARKVAGFRQQRTPYL